MKVQTTRKNRPGNFAEPHLALVQGPTHRSEIAGPSSGDPLMVSSSMRARTADAVWARVERLIECVLAGDLYQAVDEFYAPDVELGRGALAPMFGLETAAGHNFHRRNADAEWRGFQIQGVGVNGDTSFIECSLDFVTTKGDRLRVKQVAIAQWREAKIIKEYLIPMSCGTRKKLR